MGLILGITFWFTIEKIKPMKPWQRKLFANTSHVYMFLTYTKHPIPIKMMAVTCNPRDLTKRGTLQKN